VESAVIVLVIIVAAAAIAAGAYYSHKTRLARRAALAALAGELNMSFDPSQRRDFDSHYRHFELFRRGHTRRAYNTLAGTFDMAKRPFRAFMGDYSYAVTTSNGKTSTTTTYTVSYIILHTPYDGLPTLSIRPENFMDKIAGAVGFDDIDFESAEFSRAFFVKASQKRFAYDVVHPRMMEFLMATRGPAVDISHGAICLLDGNRCWETDGFRNRLAFLQQFFELWPDHLLADLDSRGAPSAQPAPER